MGIVLRWGRSAYETDAQLTAERLAAEAQGLAWTLREEHSLPHEPVDILVVPSWIRVDAAALDATGARLVIATTSGYDHVDLDACAARGVAVVRLPEARRDAVVEQALGSLVGLMRRVPAQLSAAEQGVWSRGSLPEWGPIGLDGATVAVIGLGVIGTRAAAVLRTLGAEVVEIRRGDDLSAVLPRCDAVTAHCSLTPSSRELLSASALDRLPHHAVVVNTARGAVLDVEAAVARVAEGRLRGLAVDVFPVEPYPLLAQGAAVEGVWFTPHAAGYARGLGERVAAGVEGALSAWVRDLPLPHQVV